MIPDWQKYQLKKKMEQVEKQNHYRLFQGMFEFLGVVVGICCILILIALILNLINWVRQDIGSTFAIFKSHFN